MTARDWARILLKVLGIYYLVSGALSIVHIGNFMSFRRGASAGGFFLVQGVVTLGMLAVGIVLVLYTETVLRLLFRDVVPSIGPAATVFALQAVAFSIVGVLLVAYTLPQLAASGVVLLVLSESGRELERSTYLRENWMRLVGTGFEAAAGLWLFFGARGLAAMWNRLRPIRSPRPTTGPDPT